MRIRSAVPRHTAFSLLEILIALGLFAVVVTALLALFPSALRSQKESDEETRALFIASGVMEALPSPEGVFRLATGMSNNLPVLEKITLSGGKNTDYSIAYDDSGEPIRKLSAEEVEQPLSDHAASEIVTLSLIEKPTLPGIVTAEVSVASPASAPAAGRSITRFVRLLTPPVP